MHSRNPVQKQPSGGVLKKRCSENMKTPFRFETLLKFHFGMSVLL